MRPAECLEGLDLPGGWHVDSLVHRPPMSTGGKFSVGYLVVNKEGRQAYLKALDLSIAFEQEDWPRALENLLKAFNFERTLLAECRNRRFNRVVTAIADGTIQVPANLGDFGKVPYLIFELATGDIRNEMQKWQRLDVAWALRSLHHSAVGLHQLHSVGIAHQDLKPSNVLVFPVEGAKVSDLGRASQMGTSSPTDKLTMPGDRGYAPPEQWYNWNYSPDFSVRCVTDLYHLGSLLFFFFHDCSTTQAIRLKISKKHAKQFTNSDFLQDLPYIQHAFGEVIADLHASAESFAGDLADEITIIAQQLCEPDPRRRGDPQVLAAAHIPQHDLQPYISRFDRLARTAETRMI